MRFWNVCVLVFLLLWVGVPPLTANDRPIRVVATTSVAGDWVKALGGDLVRVKVLGGHDVHGFELSAKDVVSLYDADLIVLMGLHLEDWMIAYTKDNVLNQKCVVLSDYLDTEALILNKQGDADPHYWMDVHLAIEAVEGLSVKLQALKKEHSLVISLKTQQYLKELQALDEWIVDTLRPLKGEKNIISQHDNLRYFSRRYGLSVVATVQEGVSTDMPDPSAKRFASLMSILDKKNVLFIVGEVGHNANLVNQLTREASLRPPVFLYTESLGEAREGLDSYIKIMRYNVGKLSQEFQ